MRRYSQQKAFPQSTSKNQKYQVGVVSCENTIHGLQQAINEILDLDYEQLVRNVRKAKDVFNWEAQEKVLLSLYNALN